jgi:hypothetical protein
VRKDHSVQLFDWGEALSLSQLSALSDRELARQVGVAGTPLFMAPEVLNYITDRDRDGDGQQHQLRRIITTKLDVWGAGAVLFFLLAGRDIFVADAEWELDSLADIANASTGVELPDGVAASYAARDFLRCCLQRDPARRASAQELAEHPWLFGAASFADMAAATEAAAAAAVASALEEERECFRSHQQQAAAAVVPAFQFRPAAAVGDPGTSSLPSGRGPMARPGQLSVLAESTSIEGDDAAALLAADPLTASLALASGVAGLALGPAPPAAVSSGPLQQQPAQHSAGMLPTRRGSHHRLDSYGSCKSLVALEDDSAAQLQRAADGEAVCEVRLRLSPSTASLGSIANPYVTSAA